MGLKREPTQTREAAVELLAKIENILKEYADYSVVKISLDKEKGSVYLEKGKVSAIAFKDE